MNINVIRLHVPIHHRNISIVIFTWGQKVVPAGWLPAVERLELRHGHINLNSGRKDLQLLAVDQS